MERNDKSKFISQRWSLYGIDQIDCLKGRQIQFDSMAEMVMVRARELPDKTFVYYYDEEVTYKQNNDRACQVANYLKAKGVQKGDIVSNMVQNSPDTYYAMFGAQKIGAIAGTINYMLMPPEIAYLLDDSQPKVVFVGNNFMPSFSKGYELAQYKPIVVEVATGDSNDVSIADTTMADILASYPTDEAFVYQSPSDPYLLLYSSGTTGKPKGVLLSNRGQIAVNRSYFICNNMSHDDVYFSAAPFFHVNPLCTFTYPAIYSGASIVIRKAFSPTDWWPTIMRYGVTVTWCSPAMYMYLIYQVDPATIDNSKVKIRHAVGGGAPLPKELLEDFQARFGVEIEDGYGLTESNGWACTSSLLPRKLESIGFPIYCNQAEIMDEDNNVLPFGEKGEICLRGENIMIGYLNKPEETAETIKNDWLHTGDLGWMDNQGYIYYCGRVKEMINRGGENIYPREIEIPLEAHPKVQEVAVIGKPDPALGERVKACIVVKPGETMTEQDVKDYLKEQIAKYKIPEIIEFYTELPHNASAKIDKLALKKMA